MDYMKVRCCCQPKNILGFLPEVRGAYGRFQYIERYTEPNGFRTVFRTLSLPVREFVDATGIHELAYSSEETPLSELRKIRGFVENR